MKTSIELEFADGSYLFALKLPQIIELQRTCEAGVFKIYGRVLKGRYLINDSVVAMPHEAEAFIMDCYEAIRLGLVGGGGGIVNGEEVKVSPVRAKQLVEAYVYPQPLREAWSLAAAILSALIEGYDPPAQKKSGSKRAPRARASPPPR